ncbi:MAG: hypothetical protein U0744_12520 [Gemmataceae bacterium]
MKPLRASLVAAMEEKRSEFTRWHLIDVFLNLGVIALVGVAAAMAGHLPARQQVDVAPTAAT